MKKKERHIVRFEDVRDKIVEVRGQEVILDFAVAELYGTETKEINRAVKNNPRKFPEGWVFEIDKKELENLRWKNSTTKITDKQAVTDLQSKSLTANLPSPKSRVMPKAFTERGIYMLATILNGDDLSTNETETAIELNFAVLKLKHTIKRKKK